MPRLGLKAQVAALFIAAGLSLAASPALSGSITGGVRERTTNTPVSGATVRLEQSGQIKYTTTTNSSGVYSFTGIPNGTYNLVALKSCFQNAGPFSRTLGDLTGQNIIMDWYPRLSGGVRNNLTNAPISGATVRLEQSGQIKYTTTSDGNGVYSFTCIVAGTYNLVGLKLGEYDNWSQSITLSISTASSQNIAMTPKASISGGVRDNVTNDPIGGATVRLEQSGQIKYTTTSDANGVYSITGVTSGTYNLVGLKLGEYQNWSQPRSLAPGENVTAANIAMTPTTARIAGGVRNDLTNNPIAGATVRLEQGGQILYTTTSNGTGNYAFAGIPPGDYNLVGLKLGEYVNWSQARTLAAGDNITSANIAMTPCATITGGVRDAVTNDPLSGATVRLEQGGEIKYLFQYTGSNGVYSITGVIPGTYNLVGLHLGDYINWSQQRTLGAGESVTNANIAMTPTTARISGGVRDDLTDVAISDATVRLEQGGQILYTTTSNGTGNYAFAGIPPGVYNLVGLKLGEYVNWSQARTLAAGDNITSANIAMTPCATITGGVRDIVTDEPLSGATVRLEQDRQIKYLFQYTGSNGVYSITGIVPGTYTLVGLHLGDYVNWSQQRTLGAGEHVTSANIAMNPTFARIAGGVRNVLTSVPISGATVRLEQGGQIKYVTTSNGTGNYSFTGIPPGDYNLVGLKLGAFENWSQPRTLVAGDNITTANIAMTPLTTLSGQVNSSATQAPIVGALVELFQGGTLVASATTGSNGAYSIGQINCTTYSLAISATYFVTSTTTVNPVCYMANDLNTALTPQRSPLTVRVRSNEPGNPPIAGAIVGWGLYSGRSGADGTCYLGGVDCGSGVLGVQASGFAPYQGTYSVSCSGNPTLDVSLTPGEASLSGVVSSAEPGAPPIPGAAVEYGEQEVTTGPDGSYTFGALSCGSQVLRVTADGFVGIETSTATSCDRATSYNISLARASGTVSGRVFSTDAGLHGVGDAVVRLGSLSTVTDGGGNYAFPSVDCGGGYVLSVTRTGFQSTSRWYQPVCNLSNHEDIALTPLGGPRSPWIVLVPGLCEGPEMWDEIASNGTSFVAWLQARGYGVQKVNLGNNRDHPAKLVAALEQQLPRDGRPIHIVGHSMGGLIARDLVKQFAARGDLHGIRSVTTLSTPHHGSDGAAWLRWASKWWRLPLLGVKDQLIANLLHCQAKSAALSDLVPGSAYLNKLNYASSTSLYDRKDGKSWETHKPEHLAPGLWFYTVAGTDGFCGVDRLLTSAWTGAPAGMRTDGVVAVPGQRLYGTASNWLDTDIPTPRANHSHAPFCPSPTLPISPPVWQFIADLASSVAPEPSLIARSSVVEDSSVQESSSEVPVELPCPSGTIQPGDSILVPLQVPLATGLAVHLGGANVSFDLRDPSGNWISPATPGVTYDEDSLGVAHSYQIPAPVPGQWTLRLVLPKDREAQEYVAGAFATTELVPSFEFASAVVAPAQAFHVAARLDSAGVLLAASEFRLTAYLEDSVLTSMVLHDDGTGGDRAAGDRVFEADVVAPIKEGTLSLYGEVPYGADLLAVRSELTVELPGNLRVVPGSLRLDRQQVAPGDSVLVSFDIENASTRELIWVPIEVRELASNSLLDSLSVALSPGETRSVVTTWVPSGADTVNLAAEVSASVLPSETDYADNVAFLQLIAGQVVGVDHATHHPLALRATAFQTSANTARFRIESPSAGSVSLRVFDVMGRVIWRQRASFGGSGVHDLIWNLGGESGVSSGIYFFRVSLGGESVSGRLVVIR